jgi:SSS family solute:Na+ symporter
MRRCASILSIISLFMMLVAQITASHKFLTSFGFDYLWLFILFWTIVIIYTAQGGLKAVIATDVVQVLFFSIVFLVSFSYIITALPTATLQKLPMWEHSDIVSAKAYGWLLMPLLFIVVEQDMGQRCFAASSPQIAARSALSAGIITLIICTIPIFLGVLGSTMAITIPAGSSVLMTVIAHVTNPWATALMGCAVMAAIISLINAIGSNLAHDFKLPTVKGWTFVYQAQAITCGISISAIFCAFYFNAVVDLLIQSCEFSVSCLFVPVLLAVLRGKGSFLAALLAMVFGITGFFILRLYPLAIPKEIASILLALCGYSLGEVLTYQLGITTSNEPIENNAP